MRRLLIGILFTVFMMISNIVYSEIIFEEGFESGIPETFLSDYYGNFAYNQQWTIQSIVVGSGAYSAMYSLIGGNNMHSYDHVTQHFGDSTKSPVWTVGRGTSYHDIFVQFKLYYSPGYDWSAGNNKQMIIGTTDNMRHSNSCCNPWVSHYITLLAGGSGNNGYFNGEGNNKRAASGQWFDLDPNINGYDQTNRYYIQTGRWYTIEFHKRLNDEGRNNGVFEMWIDGEKVAEYNELLYRIPWDGTYGSDFSYGTNFVMLSTYINNESPQDQYMYYDDIVIGTSYIGNQKFDTIPPSPPSRLAVD